MKTEIIDGTTWIIDENNNRMSVTSLRDEQECEQLLKTLTDCSDCSGCFGCSDCSGCSRCSGCSGCSDCSGCSPQKTEKKEIPVIPNIHKVVYEAVSKPDALNMSTWHSCETTHCRAGWVVHLAGEAGYALEKKTSALFAAMQIYKASGYEINPCRFYDANNAALEDMKRLAQK